MSNHKSFTDVLNKYRKISFSKKVKVILPNGSSMAFY